LYARFPALERKLPRARLGRFPTPVDKAEALARELGLRSLSIKRDDRSAEPYGGGKARKLELLLGAAREEGARGVITFGGVGSHHAIATAIYGNQLGLDVHLLLLPEPPSDAVRAALLACAREGAQLELAGTLTAAKRRAAALAADGSLHIIEAGGSSPLGNVGFVSAAFELAAQIERGEIDRPDDVYIALGTMGSAVGLAIGLAVAELPIRIVAVRASSPGTSSLRALKAMHAETVALLRARDPSFPDVALGEDRLVIAGDYLGKGYAEPTIKGARAIELAARHDLALEHTYTAKAFAAIVDAARRAPDRRVLYWHTHASQTLDVSDVDASRLPPELRPYAR
jgi:D-cysteine desulfhydrase